MQHIDVREAKDKLTSLIDAAVNGEEVVITKDGLQTVRLVPVSPAKPRPQFGSARGLITMSPDFDEPLDDFEEYTR